MRRETRRRIILTSLLALPVALTAAFFLFYATPHLDFVTALAHIEEVQLRKRTLAPRSSYLQAGRLAQNRTHWLSLIKRLYAYPQQPAFARYLLDLSKKAVRALPEDQTIQAFYVTALLENREFRKAMQHLPLLGPSYNSLKAEVLLKQLAQTQNLTKNELTLRDILRHTTGEDYQQVALWLDSPLLLYNSALLYLQQNKKERAWEISEQLPSDQGIPQYVLGLIAYGQGQFRRAITHFLLERDQKKRDVPAHLDQMIADSYLQLQDFGNAARYYQNAQQLGGTWHSYYNQAQAYLMQKDELSAFNSLRNGLARFPSEEHLLIRLVKMADKENRSLVIRLINEFRQQYDRNVNVELLSLMLNSEQLPHPLYITRLWQLFNYHPENLWVGQYLVWYLMGLNYQQQAKVAVERISRQQHPPPEWLAHYQGMLELLDQHPENAYPLLSQAAGSQPSAERSFNFALAQVRLGQFEPAYQTLLQGLKMNPRQLGLYIKLIRQVSHELGWGDAWREDIPSAHPERDPLLDLVRGLYLHDNTQDPGPDRHVTPLGSDTGRDISPS